MGRRTHLYSSFSETLFLGKKQTFPKSWGIIHSLFFIYLVKGACLAMRKMQTQRLRELERLFSWLKEAGPKAQSELQRLGSQGTEREQGSDFTQYSCSKGLMGQVGKGPFVFIIFSTGKIMLKWVPLLSTPEVAINLSNLTHIILLCSKLATSFKILT